MTSSEGQEGWNVSPPSDRAWKGRPGRTRDALAAEQDRAAGGRGRRAVPLPAGGFARASVELKVLPRTRRIRAYLRWSEHGKSPAKYLGEVDRPTRAQNLAAAWSIARVKGLVLDEEPLEPESGASSPAVRAVMKANKGSNTKPELRLRSLLHRAGLRYRVNSRPLEDLRRTADIVFLKPRVAVFVDGCFWHGCPEHHRPASRNSEFWQQKIEANQQRDAETNARLEGEGWTVIRVWEHEDPVLAAELVLNTVRAAK
ncbi:DNA mismatch endonuclease Vsr [Catenulispora sp. MAP12-49]|uniref:very short patch repair endonuclease n=1 Tax=Catenulispora sp. MAP12-49 TaxID=3156302 RepID=UPI0035167F07